MRLPILKVGRRGHLSIFGGGCPFAGGLKKKKRGEKGTSPEGVFDHGDGCFRHLEKKGVKEEGEKTSSQKKTPNPLRGRPCYLEEAGIKKGNLSLPSRPCEKGGILQPNPLL